MNFGKFIKGTLSFGFRIRVFYVSHGYSPTSHAHETVFVSQ